MILCFRLLAGEKNVNGADGKYFIVGISDFTVFIFQLYEDMSTWCSELKKMAISIVPSLYKLEPAPGVKCRDQLMFVRDAATALLQQLLFL